MKHRYEFRHEDHRICCASNSLDDLCPTCRVIASASAALRSASLGTRRVFRTSQPPREPTKTEGEWRDHFGKLIRGYGSVVTTTPDPYHTATDATPAPCPFDDPHYNPRGPALDGYAIGLAIRKVKDNNR